MKRIYPLMLVLFAALWVLGIYWSGAQLRVFLSVASLVVVVCTALVLSLCSFSPAEIGAAFSLGFHRSPADSVELRKAILFFKMLSVYLLLAGVMGFLVGIIVLLWALDESVVLATGLASSLITLLYSVFLVAGVAFPFRTGLTRRLHELES
jgi:flagellar motor component MotA